MIRPNQVRRFLTPAMTIALILGTASCAANDSEPTPTAEREVLGETLTEWSDGTVTYQGYTYQDGSASITDVYEGEDQDGEWTLHHIRSISCSGLGGRVEHTSTFLSSERPPETDTKSYDDSRDECLDGQIIAPEGSDAARAAHLDQLIEEIEEKYGN